MSSPTMSRTPTDRNILNPEHEDFHAAERLDRFRTANIKYVRLDSLAVLCAANEEIIHLAIR